MAREWPVASTSSGGADVGDVSDSDPRFADPTAAGETDGATVTIDLSTTAMVRRRKVTLTGDGHTITATLTSAVEGELVYLTVVQDSTGGRDCIFDSAKFAGLIRGPDLSASASTEYMFRFNGSKLQVVTQPAEVRTKRISATGTYTLKAQDHRTHLIFLDPTTASTVAGLAVSGRAGFEFGAEARGDGATAGMVTFDPSGAEGVYADAGVSGGSTTDTLQLGDSVWWRCDGVAWSET